MDLTNSLQEKFEFSTKQAAQIVGSLSGDLSAGISAGKGPIDLKATIGANLRGQYETDAQRNQAINDTVDFIKKSGYSENLDSISKATKDIKYGESQTEDQALSESFNASYDKIQSLRESNSVSEQKISKYGEALSSVHSNAVSINQNADQRFLEYLSTRQLHGREIGMDTARKMFNSWDSNAQMYAKYFVRDVLKPEALNNVSNSITQGKAAINTTFDNTSVGSIDKQKAFESVYSKAASKGITRNVVQNQGLKDQVESKLNDANLKIEERRVDNTKKTGDMQKKADHKYDGDLLADAVANSFTSGSKNKEGAKQ